ncbi:N-acetyltransferase [Kribbella sp. NPDC056861]|uniref:GNAT family N-acetyltransferase n=1 Tax=Kribbella sp. NPDC056861 TaxID=3154857 RepID=UPI003417FAD6
MIRVRRAELDDVEAVRAVGLKTWPVAYDGLVSDEFMQHGLAEWWSVQAVERSIDKGITLVAVADDEQVVGMVGLGQEQGFWVMWKLYVLPEYQGQGVGKALLDAAIAALPRGVDQLLLDVLVTNEPAIGFYRKNGFGTARSTPDRELGDELMWMALDL